MEIRRQGGAILLLVLVAVAVALASAAALAIASAGAAARDAASERALAQAREALIAYAADRPIDARVGPGYLPCPDLDDDGWAEATCGSLTGHIGQAERLGRLPWKTLGLPDLRDGHGERLWYAVSSRHKGLLNCAASRACVDMTPPAALGTISVRAPSGELLHDGTLSDPLLAARAGAAAVVIAPGATIRRRDGHAQHRGCSPGECNAQGHCVTDPPMRAARCDPRNYLDAAPLEDNAAFHDRNDAAGRAANLDGFVQGPVHAEGALAVNDRIAVVAYPDLMARVKARIALELAHCLRTLGTAPPAPERACAASTELGRVPDAALASSACNADPGETGWWPRWRPHVLYARAAPGGMDVVDAHGRRIASERRFAVMVTQRPGECAAGIECDARGCTRVTSPARDRGVHDALAASR